MVTGNWKVIAKGSPGSASEFGSDDTDFINKWHRGDDISTTHSTEINSTTTFRSGKLKIARPADMSAVYTFVAAAITSDRQITLPLLTTADTLVTQAFDQPLTNKTISGASNTLSNIPKSALPSSTLYNDQNNDVGDFYLDFGDIAAPSDPASGKIRLFLNSATGELSVRKSGGTTVSLEAVGGGGGTWDPASAETLTNKTIDFANNTLTGVASTGTAQTLLNKTLTTPIIATIKPDASNSLNLPVVTDTLVALTNAQTLLNKTIDFGSNTLTNVASTTTAQSIVGAKTFSNNMLKLEDLGADHVYTISAPNLAANVNLNLPNLTTSDTVVTEAHPQTLSSKTIDGASNTLPNVFVYPDKKLVGFYTPHQITAAAIGTGTLLSGVPAVTGTLATTTNATDGKYVKFTTAATLDALSGVRINHIGGHMVRAKQPRFKCRFRLNTQTDVRMFAGLYGSVSAFATGEDPFNAVNAIGVFLRVADTNFQIASNNGSGATVFADTFIGKDANIHVIEIKADAGDTGWQWSMDGGAFSSVITAEVPASGTGVGPHVSVQNSAAAAANMDMWYTIIDCNP